MWIHLLTLNLIDGAGGAVEEEVPRHPYGRAKKTSFKTDDDEILEFIHLFLSINS